MCACVRVCVGGECACAPTAAPGPLALTCPSSPTAPRPAPHSIQLLLSPKITVKPLSARKFIPYSIRFKARLDKLPPPDDIADILQSTPIGTVLGQGHAFPTTISKHATVKEAMHALASAPGGVLAVTNGDFLGRSTRSIAAVAPLPIASSYIGWLDAPTLLAARLLHGHDGDIALESLGRLLQFDIEEAMDAPSGSPPTSPPVIAAFAHSPPAPSVTVPEPVMSVSVTSLEDNGSSSTNVSPASATSPDADAVVPLTLEAGVTFTAAVRRGSLSSTAVTAGSPLVPAINLHSRDAGWQQPAFRTTGTASVCLAGGCAGVQVPRSGGRYCRNPFWALTDSTPLEQVCVCLLLARV